MELLSLCAIPAAMGIHLPVTFALPNVVMESLFCLNNVMTEITPMEMGALPYVLLKPILLVL
jgi:hypothetical protein